MYRVWRILLVALALPTAANAAIVMNEVAWMGTDISANDEWIELLNTVDTNVALDGWVLDDGMNLEIPLTGSLASGQYAVLERTDDSSAPGSAFLIYTGALTNTGATLTLFRSDGAIEDRIVGGENWEQIGGDNVTKETGQYTEKGWITAVATPGTSNAMSETIKNSEESGEGDISSAKTSKRERVSLVLSDAELSLSVEAPNTVYVRQPVYFEVEPSGLGEVIMDSLSYEWNFGDMHTAAGKEVVHTFQYPGEYVVTVRGTYARHEQIARMNVVVLPVKFSITKNLRGDIQIHNDARYEVTISGYTLVGEKSFVFPAQTIMLPGATITVPKEVLGTLNKKQIQLLDIEHTLAVAYNSEMQSGSLPTVAQEITTSKSMSLVTSNPSSDDFVFDREEIFSDEDAASTLEVESATSSATPSPVATVAVSGGIPKEAFPFIGLIGVMTLGIFSVYATGRKKI